MAATSVDQALRDPAEAFASPADILRDGNLTTLQKRDLLRRWRYDALELAVAADEGMPEREDGLLDSIELALSELAGPSPAEAGGAGWNVVVTTAAEGYSRALQILARFGEVERTPYYNVLALTVRDPLAFLDALERRAAQKPVVIDSITRVAPAEVAFFFSTRDDLMTKVDQAARQWLPLLADASFHVRLRHRGTGDTIHGPETERAICDALLAGLAERGTPGRKVFDDPDAVLAVDIVDNRAGLGLWSRSDMAHYRFLRPD